MMKQYKAEIFDTNPCHLGEGPIWHPQRNSLLWFDIVGRTLYERQINEEKAVKFELGLASSAAGWINEEEILIANSQALICLNLETKVSKHIADLENMDQTTRSNDGRADRHGGFWIGTMGWKMEKDKGAIYRYYRRELRKLFHPITIPNSICFTPSGETAYFTDTSEQKIMRVSLDSMGWPKSEPEVFMNFQSDKINPDGSVVDLDGCFWNAQWGSARVAKYNPAGELLAIVEIEAPQSSCPAFGGEDLSTLYITSAREGMSKTSLNLYPKSGFVFSASLAGKGQKENQVII